MTQQPSKYRLVVANQSFIDPRDMVLMALDVIINKLTMLESILQTPVDDLSYIDITEIPDGISVKIFNETYTIGNILSYYCYKVDSTIPNISCKKTHPSLNYITVEIYHATPRQILMQAIGMAKKEISGIKDSF
jgi:DNA-directed RNA polymerase subunit L